MSDRDGYQPGVPCWVDTPQPEVGAATGFYGELFGWSFAGPGDMPGDPPGEYYVARKRGRDVAGISSRPPGAATAWNTYVQVASADAAAAAARRAGGRVVTPPFDTPPAGRMAILTDPEDALFCVWEPTGRAGAQVVNEPSAWSMSLLSTRDPERASAFYGELFGWIPDTSFGDLTLWRLPGYIGGEPAQPVPRDVVAGAITADQARWNVDFWIEDVDDAARRAEQLGGHIVSPPADTPIFRQAVIADPQGAAFSVSALRAS